MSTIQFNTSRNLGKSLSRYKLLYSRSQICSCDLLFLNSISLNKMCPGHIYFYYHNRKEITAVNCYPEISIRLLRIYSCCSVTASGFGGGCGKTSFTNSSNSETSSMSPLTSRLPHSSTICQKEQNKGTKEGSRGPSKRLESTNISSTNKHNYGT